MAKKKILQDSSGQIWPITVADCVYLTDGSKTLKKYIDDALSGKSDTGHTHNAIVSRGNVTCESGVTGRPAVGGLSMSCAYNNGYPTSYGNVISLKGTGDGQILVGWSGTDGAHAPVYVRSKRDNTSTANWSEWAQVYTTAHKPTLDDIDAAASSHTHNYAGSSSAGGAANSATKLATARTINGTSFDGSANITTANWGTARKINQIAVNGSADVKLPLDYYTCNIGNSNAKPYHHILTTGQCTGSYTDKSITIVLVNHYNSAGLGIAKATLRTNDAANGATASGELRWLVRSGFAENQLCFNIRNTAKDTYMDVFYKSTGTYNSLTWYVLTEGGRGSHGSQWTKYSTHHDNGTNVYDETGMKAIRTYTATLQSAVDHGAVNSAKTAAACSGNAATATKLANAKAIKIGDKSLNFDGSDAITYTLADIGAQSAKRSINFAADHVSNWTSSSAMSGLTYAGGWNGAIGSDAYLSFGNSGNNIVHMFIDGEYYAKENKKVYHEGNKPTPADIGAAASSHGTHLTLGTGSGNAYYGDKGNTAYTHSQAAHAPSNAQKNSDITKAEIEAKLTGTITSHTHNHLEVKGTNTITSTANDTTANWGAQKTSIHWYTTAGQLIDQPAQWGYILNVGKDSEVHQLWMTQSSGDLKHRGGNSSGWNGSWRTLLDSSNYSSYAVPKSGGTMTGTLTVPRLDFPVNPNDTDDFAYITVVHTGKRTAMEFHVGNNCQIEGADDTQNPDWQDTNDDRFIWRLPDIAADEYPEMHNDDSHTMQLYNWWMIGGWPCLKVSEIKVESLYSDTVYAGCEDYHSTINKLRPTTSNISESYVGDKSYRFQDVYCTRGAFNGSDSKLKEDIKSISRRDFNGGIELISDEEIESNVSSYDLYDYIKNASLYSYKYRTTNEASDADYYVGILADNIPNNVFNVIGTYSKTEEEYQKELEERPAIIERYNKLLEAGLYENEKPGVMDRVFGMSLAEIKDRALNEPEEPVRLINAPAQVSMLQEVLSIALNKIEIDEEVIDELKNNVSKLEDIIDELKEKLSLLGL